MLDGDWSSDVCSSDLLEACDARAYDRAKVMDLVRELEFNSLVKDLPPAGAASTAAPAPEAAADGRHSTAGTREEIAQAAPRPAAFHAVALDSVGENPMYGQALGLAISHQTGQATYVPLAGAQARVPPDEAVAILKPALEDPAVPKWGHDIKRALVALSQVQPTGVELQGIAFDTMLAAHLLGEKSLALGSLALGRLRVEMPEPPKPAARRGARKKASEEEPQEPVPDLFALSNVPVARPPWPEGTCAEADMVARLAPGMEHDLKGQGLWRLYTEVELPLIPVLATMERNGIAVDTEVLVQMSHKLGERLRDLELQVYNEVGHQFNINSPQQLGLVLFEERGIDRRLSKKTKTGWSTDAQILEKLRGVDPVIEHILEYRELSKLKSTYLDALPGLVHPHTGRLHTTFNQAGAATGRLSSNEPNLQNIPVRTDLGREIRKAFRAERAGWTLLGADYSQIDLRVLAHLSGDPAMIAAFREGEDIHRATAAQIFGLAPEQVDANHRRMAKTINFGIVYGISSFGLSERIEGLSREDAGKFIAAYFQRYPGIKDYMERTIEQARKDGYVQTLLGRRRYIPEVHASNFAQRQAAERVAINMPVQGTSADIIKVAMVRLHERMRLEGLRSLLLLQIHDELLFEAPEDELERLKALCQEVMPASIELAVPIKIDLKVGRTWGDME
jgi:DNA polymerase-1